MNETLEKKVNQRIEALEIRNRVLAVSQVVHDVLPIAVFGIDPEQMIAQCNDMGQDAFPIGGIGLLGNNRQDIFTDEINLLVDSLGDQAGVEGQVTVRKIKYRAVVRRIDGFTAKGLVVALIPLGI